jgi:hypothetical protein
MSNISYKTFITIKLLVGKVGEFWWETRLRLKLIVGHCIAPEGILSTWTIISYIVGHCVVMANPTCNLRFSIRMFGSALVDVAVKVGPLP